MNVANDLLGSLFFIIVGCISGFMNTVASSGTAVSLPMMIFYGLDPMVANATNRLPILAGFSTSVFNFARAGKMPWRPALILSLPVAAGTTAGAMLVGTLPAFYIRLFVSIALFISILVILLNPRRFLITHSLRTELVNWKNMLTMFTIGVWAGIIVLDSAIFTLCALVMFMGFDLLKANAIKNFLILIVGVVSILVFLFSSTINWHVGLALSAGSMAGSYIGSKFALKEGSRKWVFIIIKAIIAIELLVMIAKQLQQAS